MPYDGQLHYTGSETSAQWPGQVVQGRVCKACGASLQRTVSEANVLRTPLRVANSIIFYILSISIADVSCCWRLFWLAWSIQQHVATGSCCSYSW